MRNIEAVTPGELLKEEFLEPMGISQYRLAKKIGVPAQRIGQIIGGKAFDNRRHGPATLSFLWFDQWLLVARSGSLRH